MTVQGFRALNTHPGQHMAPNLHVIHWLYCIGKSAIYSSFIYLWNN